ncbi:MAG: hypothetical protein Q8P08_01885 [bacterium]|nr:hypothetical protein [bacterium]
MSRILSPIGALEAVIVIPIALILDLIGPILTVFGITIPIAWLMDVIGLATLGLWSFFRSGKMPITKKLMRFVKRPGLAYAGELAEGTFLLPITFDLIPCWTVLVIFELLKD